MRLTGTDDTDIALDQYGQPVVGEDGDVRLVSEEDCWIQDVWMEMLTEEGELLHEDKNVPKTTNRTPPFCAKA